MPWGSSSRTVVGPTVRFHRRRRTMSRDAIERLDRAGPRYENADPMEIRELALPDVFLITPDGHPDDRGVFYESFRRDLLSAAIGREFTIEQSNLSISRRGVLRGIHGVRGLDSQAKLVTCLRGAAPAIVLDLRVGSPPFRRHAAPRPSHRSPRRPYPSAGPGRS